MRGGVSSSTPDSLVSTGIDGLDAVLQGGLPSRLLHLVSGMPGTGKTTLGLQFALSGLRAGESSLYVTLAETVAELRAIAGSHGWVADGLAISDQSDIGTQREETQTVFHPSEVELPAILDTLLERVESARPDRLVIDSLSELRSLAHEPRWFRREMMRLRGRVVEMGCSAMVLDGGNASADIETLVGGVIRLETSSPAYGPSRRRVTVEKMRGHQFQTGAHDMRIRTGGIEVYPRLVAAEHRVATAAEMLSTGLPELDAMFGGGLDRGSAVLLMGSTGTGKSTLALQCAAAAAARGEGVLYYVFDERTQTVLQRARGVGIEIERHIESGRMELRQVDPAEFTPGEFAEEVRGKSDAHAIRIVVIDSLNAYLYAMPEERFLEVHLHELMAYLSQQGVTALLIAAHGELGRLDHGKSRLDISYLADSVVLLGIAETGGRLRKVLTVSKRRAGRHLDTVRELHFGSGGVSIGEVLPLQGLSGHFAVSYASAGEGSRGG